MNDRTARLRRASLDAVPTISHERASLLTDFYQANEGKYSIPVMRARSFHYLCERKTIYLGEDVRQVDLWGRARPVPSENQGSFKRQKIEVGVLPTFVTGVNPHSDAFTGRIESQPIVI